MRRKIVIPILLVLLIVIGYAATLPTNVFKDSTYIWWGKTDTTLTPNLDTLALKPALRIYIDSLINLTTSSAVREELKFHFTANFSNNLNDSINLLVNNTFQIIQFAYNMYADRIMVETNKPGELGPSTFRDDLPRVSPADTLLILRLSRNNSFSAGQKIGLTLYKVARSTGLSHGSTAGVFYDMLRFDEAQFNTAGTSTQISVQLLLKKNR